MREKYKKILFILIMFSLTSLQGFAITPAQNLALIENQVFGYENSKQKDNERLNSIENFVYGSAQKGSTSERISKLNQDLGIEPDEKKKEAIAQRAPDIEDYANEPTDASAQYPIVDNIETALLNKTYTTENIYKRLDRLEHKAFGKVLYGSLSLSERVEKLAELVPSPSPKRETYDAYMANNENYNYYSPATNGNPRSSNGTSSYASNYGSSSYGITASELSALESAAFGKSFASEPTSKRLSRLEKKILHKDFSNESEEARLERLATVAAAQQSANVYKENKLMQHLATGVQIGSMILMILAMIL